MSKYSFRKFENSTNNPFIKVLNLFLQWIYLLRPENLRSIENNLELNDWLDLRIEMTFIYRIINDFKTQTNDKMMFQWNKINGIKIVIKYINYMN
jgi:hypothetical protein